MLVRKKKQNQRGLRERERERSSSLHCFFASSCFFFTSDQFQSTSVGSLLKTYKSLTLNSHCFHFLGLRNLGEIEIGKKG